MLFIKMDKDKVIQNSVHYINKICKQKRIKNV